MISLYEMAFDHVVGVNRSVIFRGNSDLGLSETHGVRNPSGLKGCLAGIFYQDTTQGYLNLPIEKMAGLMLYRISEGQFFINGNKRTALISTKYFLGNNGYGISYNEQEMSDLLWGFAKPIGKPGVPAKYSEVDSINFVTSRVYVLN